VKSGSIYFAKTSGECSLEELKPRSTKCSNTSGLKIPTQMLTNQTLVKIDGKKTRNQLHYSKFNQSLFTYGVLTNAHGIPVGLLHASPLFKYFSYLTIRNLWYKHM
jgi:hypothetical protein